MCVENMCSYVHAKFETKLQNYITFGRKTKCSSNNNRGIEFILFKDIQGSISFFV
jgi:hypothetical protein